MSKAKTNKNYGKYALVVLLMVFFDQLTKYFIRTNFQLGESLPVIKNFFSITYIVNTGAGFSILQDQNAILLFVSIFVFGLLLYYFDTFKTKSERFAAAAITGGIAGNVIDRIFLGSVVDFVSFSFWPAFNVADSAITIGIIYLIICDLKKNQ
jgi:signal peptidase II